MPWWDPNDPKKVKRQSKAWLGDPGRRPGPERSRRMAEMFAEFVSTDSDGDGYGFGRKPFGTMHTGGALLRFLKRGVR